MKYLVIICAFLMSLSSSAQLLEIEPVELTISLSLLELPNFQDRSTNMNDLKNKLKPYTFSNDELEKIRQGNFVINAKSLNKNFTFSEPASINLKKELRKIILEIPREFGPIRPKGFTL